MSLKKIAPALFLVAMLCHGAEAHAEPVETAPPPPVNTYKSKHGFKIDYPKNWILKTDLEEYDTLKEAARDGGNYFAVQSYQPDDPRIQSFHYFPADTLKMEAWIFPDENQSLAEIITQTKDVMKIDDFDIGGKKAKKVWQRLDDGESGEEVIYSIYFVDAGKRAVFTCYPTYSTLTGEFEKMVGSFRFE